MSEAPERIVAAFWVSASGRKNRAWWAANDKPNSEHPEFVRADRYDEAIRQRDELKAAAIKAHLCLCGRVEAEAPHLDTMDARIALANAIAACSPPLAPGEKGDGDRLDLSGPTQPASGYTKNVTPRGPVVRPEDAFPESCCEGTP